MSKKKEQPAPEAEQTTVETEAAEQVQTPDPAAEAAAKLAEQEDKFLRLAAEYDNFRKRTAKEREALWTEVKANTAAAFLPVYDNLERAIKQETADEAYKKGVEMTMNQLREVFAGLGIEEIPAQGQTFDPNLHNAVMHVDDENFGENEIVEVFQAGFRCGEKVIRFSMVKVAN
ncbi:MAG: nucleotide exchange factor GrpE [Ruminococcaceae bacterium]|nr:nucleotide exchange factor GrpE [Oscillospiraceae bacterium]